MKHKLFAIKFHVQNDASQVFGQITWEKNRTKLIFLSTQCKKYFSS